MRRSLIFTIAALAGLALAATATATTLHTASPPASNAVSFDHLDLGNGYDADIALTRIEAAARRVCGFDLRPHSLQERRAAALCINDAVASSVVKIGAPLLSAHYAARGPIALVAL